jgi:hypothetical protein
VTQSPAQPPISSATASNGGTASSYPAVPSSLANDTAGYRPGSTAGAYGVQNANYNQAVTPTTASPSGGYVPSGSSVYGNTYMR